LPSAADEDENVSRLEALAALAAAARNPLLSRIDIDFSSLSEDMALHHLPRSTRTRISLVGTIDHFVSLFFPGSLLPVE
jgi:hypothetical protein